MGPGFRRDDELLIGFNAFFGASRYLIEAEMCESDSGESRGPWRIWIPAFAEMTKMEGAPFQS